MNRHRPLALLVLVATFAGSTDGHSQAPKEPSEIRKAAEQLVESIELEAPQGSMWVKVKRIDRPLLSYTDPTRDFDRGFLWAWGDTGRPLATLEMFQTVNIRATWAVDVFNTSGGKLRAGRAGAPWWLKNDSDIAFKDVPAAPPVAPDPNLRQRQMKQLVQNFTAWEWYKTNVRVDLRRLDRPLHTYRDEDAGIVEGGLFAFANGTNPEVLLFVEARQKAKGSKPVWQFGVGRSSAAKLHVEHEGKEVYSCPWGDSVRGPDKPFWSARFQFTPTGNSP